MVCFPDKTFKQIIQLVTFFITKLYEMGRLIVNRAAYRAIGKYILSNSGKPEMVIPSQAPVFRKDGEGVETVWQVSQVDKETVQTTNLKKVAKAIVVSITNWSLVRSQPGPPK